MYMKYTDAKALMDSARNRANGKPLENNTRLFDRGDHFAVQLHATDIVGLYPDGSFTFDTGGWHTRTTKARMHAYAPTYVNLQSRKGIWHIAGSAYYDGMRFDSNGKPLAPQVADDSLSDKLDLAIRKYKKDFVAAMGAIVRETGKLPHSDGGDCWGCSMVTADGKNDILTGMTHYFDHFREGYFVPALLERAIIEQGYVNPGFTWHLIESDFNHGRTKSRTISLALTSYFRKRKVKMLAALRENNESLAA